MLAPITFGDARFGGICLQLDSDQWSSAARDLLEAMASGVGLAVRNAWLFGQVGLANRRLQSTVANAGTPIVCVGLDGLVTL